MTESEWLACTDPTPMLEFLHGRSGKRKPLLFLCACYRHVWHLSAAKEGAKRKLIEVVEQFADGRASREQVIASNRAVARAEQRSGIPLLSDTAWEAWPAEDLSWEEIVAVAWRTRYGLACDRGKQARPEIDSWKAQSLYHKAWSVTEIEERRRQADLLRDIFGNPYSPITIDPAWLTWHGGVLVSMAQKMYDSRDFTDMPVLADALEEAGCTNPDILGHCRQQGAVHVRGCWVIDCLLAKG